MLIHMHAVSNTTQQYVASLVNHLLVVVPRCNLTLCLQLETLCDIPAALHQRFNAAVINTLY
jgi:hypothetical protein